MEPILKNTTVTTIPKRKIGPNLFLTDERGIFNINLIKLMSMKLIFNSKYATIDSKLSDTSVGSRKGRSCLNNIFIVNCVIHDILIAKDKEDVQVDIYDCAQFFDSMDHYDT